MPSGNEQKKIREVDFVGQTHRQRMTFEMVDGKKRLSSRPSQALCHHRTDYQTPDQTGSGGGGNAIDLSKHDPRLREGTNDQAVQVVEMRPRRDFGHDPAVRSVFGKLRLDQV